MPKAFSYLRFSTPDQMKGDSFRRQTQLAEQYATRHGLQLDTSLTLQDLGVSAFRGRNAKHGALRRFLDAVEEGVIDEGSYLLVESLDRISREAILSAQGLFLQIIEAGIVLVTLTDQRAYSKDSINQNPTDLIISLVTMMRAHDESAMKARRLKAVWEGKRGKAASRPLTARAPAWLQLTPDRTWSVREDRADVVRRIFNMAADGVGQNSISATLNREGVPTFGDSTRKAAQHWHRSYVYKILHNPAVVGIFVPHVQEYVEGRKKRTAQSPIEDYFPSIIEREVYERVQALAMDSVSPQRGRHAHKGIQNVFGGLAQCPHCKGTMTRVSKGSRAKAGKPYLVCRRAKEGAGCTYRAVPLDQVQEALLQNASYLIAHVPARDGDHGLDAELSAMRVAIEGTEDQLETLLDDLTKAPSPAISGRVREMEATLEEMRRSEQELWERLSTSHGPLLERRLANLSQALEADPLDIGRANVALRQVLSSAVVNYQTGQLELNWLHGGTSSVIFGWPEKEAA